MEAVCPSEMLMYFYTTTRRYIPEGSIFRRHRCEILFAFDHEAQTEGSLLLYVGWTFAMF
jgi:hypothetical protein